ncbi:MAG: TonB family protein [Chloracidobacterium sp.]|nr:TonB family protein [Chloracidobacterium sp.]MDW8217051.1 TonB family protein [Acidobacteriota bacterium]
MRNDYLWDKSGEPTPDVVELEAQLGRYSFRSVGRMMTVNDFNRISETAATVGVAEPDAPQTPPREVRVPNFAGFRTEPLPVRLFTNLRDTARDFIRNPRVFFWHTPTPDEQGMFSAGLYFEPAMRSLFHNLADFVRRPSAFLRSKPSTPVPDAPNLTQVDLPPLWSRIAHEISDISRSVRANPAGYVAAQFAMTRMERRRAQLFGLCFLFAFFVMSGLVGVVLIWPTPPPPVVQEEEKEEMQLISMLESPPLPPPPPPDNRPSGGGAGFGLKTPGKGGGGGGKTDPEPAMKGRLPEPTLDPTQQIVDPTTKPRIEEPSLPVAPKIIADPRAVPPPDLKVPIGDPNSTNTTKPSDGTGKQNAGIGNGGDGRSVGSGTGPGGGPGSGGGVGGGVAGGPAGRGSGDGDGTGITQRPKLIYSVKPKYTEEARVNKIQGTVVLTATVGPDGSLSNIRVVKSLGYGLDEKAIEAARQCRFQPAMVDGRPVAATVRFSMEFRLL